MTIEVCRSGVELLAHCAHVPQVAHEVMLIWYLHLSRA